MDRIAGANTIDIGSGRRGFRAQNKAAGIAGTELAPGWFNGLQEEVMAVIEGAGLVADAGVWTQLRTAIGDMISTAISAIDLSDYVATTAIATVAEIRTGAAGKLLSADRTWSAGAPVALVDAATITIDMSAGINFGVTLGGNRTLAFPTDVKVGQSGFVVVTQDATGGRTLSYGAGYEFFDGLVPDLSTAPGAVNLLYYLVVSPSVVAVTYVRGLA